MRALRAFVLLSGIALLGDDYAILRAWERRASLGGYLTVVVQRLLSDERSRRLGRYLPNFPLDRRPSQHIFLGVTAFSAACRWVSSWSKRRKVAAR